MVNLKDMHDIGGYLQSMHQSKSNILDTKSPSVEVDITDMSFQVKDTSGQPVEDLAKTRVNTLIVGDTENGCFCEPSRNTCGEGFGAVWNDAEAGNARNSIKTCNVVLKGGPTHNLFEWGVGR